jgi:hypothetical protein
MADLQAIASFTNVQLVESLSMTLAHGITPSQAVLRILPQSSNIFKRGRLACQFGAFKFGWDDALADVANATLNASGQVIAITILDRRWKWAFPIISGHYNVRDSTGEIFKDKGTENAPKKDYAVSDSTRTPKELIELCLKALGETNYTIDAITDDIKPEVHWERENAAQALQQICSIVGMRIVLQLDGRIAIRKIGQGQALNPNLPYEEYSAQLDPPDKPSKLKVVCGPTWFQVDLELEAVGMERDGEIKLIDDLSYKPTAGWSTVAPKLMDEIQGVEDRNLARNTVYRWYRVKLPAEIGGFKDTPVKFHKQILLLGMQVYTHKVLGKTQNRRDIVWGEYYDPDEGEAAAETLDDIFDYLLSRAVVPYSHTVDQENCLIAFDEPVFKTTDEGTTLEPAEIKLRTAVQIRDAKTGEWIRHDKELDFDKAAGTDPRELVVSELRLDFSDGKERNRDKVDKELQKHLDIMKADYDFVTPEFVRYSGWLPVELDGAIQAVSWQMDQSGATTTVQRNNDDGSETTQAYQMRRLQEEYILAMSRLAKMDPQNRIGDLQGGLGAFRGRLPSGGYF